MASATRHREPGQTARMLGAAWNHLCRIRYRLLLINVLVVAVPIIGIGFARTFESEMLVSLENDMIHQAQLVRETLLHDPGGLKLDRRSPMLEQAADRKSTRLNSSHSSTSRMPSSA